MRYSIAKQRPFAFFFQAEDGIRDKLVTGVQTCALPVGLPRGVTLHPRLPVVTCVVLQAADLNYGGLAARRRIACGVRLALEVGADGPDLDFDAGRRDGAIADHGPYDDGRLGRGPAGGDRRRRIATQLRDGFEATPTIPAATPTAPGTEQSVQMTCGPERQQRSHERGGWRRFLPLAHGLASLTSAALQPVCLSCVSVRLLAGRVQRCDARSRHLRCVSEVTRPPVIGRRPCREAPTSVGCAV